MHPHWNSTPKAPPTTEERIAALEERMAAMQAAIDELRAKVQVREPIGRPSIGTPLPWNEHDRISEKLELAKQATQQAKRQGLSNEWQKAAQPDLFPSHKPQEPRHTPRQFLDIEKRQEAWARGYVDPNRPDQATSVLPSGVRIMGVSASIDGKQLSTAETRNLIDRLWDNAQTTQAQADRDGENLKE